MERTAADSPGRAQSADSIDYTYRETEPANRPLALLKHFLGNLDKWDPVLVDRPPSPFPFVGFASYADSSQPPQLCGFEVSRDLPSHGGCDLAGEAEVDAAVDAGVDDLGHAGGEAGHGAGDAGHAG
jgi:hypothetical protein